MLYTIGYTAFPIDDFIRTLKQNKIKAVVDVRSHPYSEYYQDYNKENLERLLGKDKIQYRNFTKEFGARQEDRQYYTPEGYLDFEKFVQSPAFIEGYNRVKNALDRGHRIALMCAEKDPIRCHRCIMVARVFYQNGIEVTHLLADGKTETQYDIDRQLLDQYHKDRYQMSMFGNPDDDELIEDSYKQQNRAIGFKIGGEEQ